MAKKKKSEVSFTEEQKKFILSLISGLEAYFVAGNDMPKQLFDVICSTESQLEQIYYQPEEKYIIASGYASDAVWHNKQECASEMARLFPNESVNIIEYNGDDIEDRCYMDDE